MTYPGETYSDEYFKRYYFAEGRMLNFCLVALLLMFVNLIYAVFAIQHPASFLVVQIATLITLVGCAVNFWVRAVNLTLHHTTYYKKPHYIWLNAWAIMIILMQCILLSTFGIHNSWMLKTTETSIGYIYVVAFVACYIIFCLRPVSQSKEKH